MTEHKGVSILIIISKLYSSGDGWLMLMQQEIGWTCTTNSSNPTICTEDRKKFSTIPEYCDDGNSKNGDGCSSSWFIETWYTWSRGISSTTDIWIINWGNGIRESVEQWDYWNLINEDGWDKICSFETGYECIFSTAGLDMTETVWEWKNGASWKLRWWKWTT